MGNIIKKIWGLGPAVNSGWEATTIIIGWSGSIHPLYQYLIPAQC